MCRALLYLGKPVLLDNLLFQPDSALVRQSYMPKMLHMLNLAGFGMRAWDPATPDPDRPFSYYSQSLPVFDRNLKYVNTSMRCEGGAFSLPEGPGLGCEPSDAVWAFVRKKGAAS